VLETRIGNDAIYRLRTDEPGIARVE